MSIATRSVCSLDTATIEEGDEDITVASRSSSSSSLNEITVVDREQQAVDDDDHDLSRRIEDYFSSNVAITVDELIDH
ncbi:hypothetical protein LINGRAHAP2_LOCUS12567 [Linum grandiflorum]